MRSRLTILLTLLAVAFAAMAEEGTVVPLSELKKSSVLKPAASAEQAEQDEQTQKTPVTKPYVEDESAPTPAIPALPDASSSSGEMPAVPEVPELPTAGDMPSVNKSNASFAPAPKAPAGNAEAYSDENSLPAPMGEAVAAAFGTKDVMGKKTVPVTMPRDRRVVRHKLQLNALAENASVIDKTGVIYKNADGWFWVKYESSPGVAPLAPQRLLPCRILQSVEEIIAGKPDTKFSVYGQAMIYDGMTYLMLRRVTVEEDTQKRIDAVTLKDSQTGEAYVPTPVVKSAANARPTEVANAPSSAAEAIASTDDILAGMMKETEGKTIRTADAPTRSEVENKVSVAPAGQVPLTQERENLVADRLARVVKSKHSDWYEVHFISDNTLREPPYLVLPNSKLDESLRLNSYLGFHNRKLRISGEVVYYKGRRYILLTKVFPERDMRQF